MCRPYAWFLEIDLVHKMCVCVSAPEVSKTSGAMWYDMDPIRLVKQVLHLLYGSYCLYRIETKQILQQATTV